MIAKRHVAVIGGGPAGLTTALALAMQGASVCVYEQADRLGDIGAGLQISPNGARALAAIGLTDGLQRIGLPSDAVIPTNGVTGRQIARFDLTGQMPRYRFVARPALIAMLADACAARGVDIRLGAAVADDALDADMIVGADGIKSATRTALNGADAPQFSGQVAWRAIVTAPAPPVARIWMMPGRHVVTYPLTDGRLNVVAVQERETWADEGWHHADEPDALRHAFPDACAALQEILWAVDTPHLWGLFRHPVAARWHDARRVLVGDAAHPTLPFLAQGANLALEDAVVLARCVGRHGITDGLPRYQALRQDRVRRAIAAADANAVNYHLGGIRRQVAHTGLRVLGKVAPDAFIKRLDWLYGFDPAT
ncbi:FAD-dependent oxidoreductase [Loktanella sp. SALINAS62]|uniref:FAD-dependent oxidoreductase n=1 Tax=Loktanella sp. SALINAS62 TaxID=2706124 RepID=UPI001B8D05B4|nr:FAD-dependent oxidoreductase [Loktanella sp. SALINAS62]MBS1304174.1 NAD(P)-binding protein [Loktanella sp. SALINAS62]